MVIIMSVKAMLIVAVMQAWTAEGGVAQYTSEYSSWEKCIEAKTLVLSQQPRQEPEDIVAVCVPVENENKSNAERELWRNLNAVLKALKPEPNPLTE